MGVVEILKRTFSIRNPATNEVTGTSLERDVDDLEEAIKTAAAALPLWPAQSGRAGGRLLRLLFELIVESRVDIGWVVTAENGTARRRCGGQGRLLLSFFEWFAEEAPTLYETMWCRTVMPALERQAANRRWPGSKPGTR